MRRQRFQRGSLQDRKHGRHKVRVGIWYEDGTRRSKVLGRCAQMTRSDAEAALAAILLPINQRRSKTTRPIYTFGQFVEHVYLPHCRRTWKASTELTTVPLINNHLVEAFGCRPLAAVTRNDMQDLLESVADTHSRSVVGHLRWSLNAIYKLAVSDGLVGHNPAAELRIPRLCKTGRQIRPLTEEEVLKYLEVFDLPERLMARLAIFEGLRPGEVLALRLRSIEHEAIWIRERVYQGKFDTPKNGRPRQVALSDGTIADMRIWLGIVGSSDPDAFVFPSENTASPLDMGNLWRRTFRPRLEKVGLPWATFQVLRKTNATLSRKAGVDAKVSADQRGHGLGVGMAVYTISDIQQKRDAVKKLESAVTRKPQRTLSA